MVVSAADRDLCARAAEEMLLLPESGQALLGPLGEKYGDTAISFHISGEMSP